MPKKRKGTVGMPRPKKKKIAVTEEAQTAADAAVEGNALLPPPSSLPETTNSEPGTQVGSRKRGRPRSTEVQVAQRKYRQASEKAEFALRQILKKRDMYDRTLAWFDRPSEVARLKARVDRDAQQLVKLQNAAENARFVLESTRRMEVFDSVQRTARERIKRLKAGFDAILEDVSKGRKDSDERAKQSAEHACMMDLRAMKLAAEVDQLRELVQPRKRYDDCRPTLHSRYDVPLYSAEYDRHDHRYSLWLRGVL